MVAFVVAISGAAVGTKIRSSHRAIPTETLDAFATQLFKRHFVRGIAQKVGLFCDASDESTFKLGPFFEDLLRFWFCKDALFDKILELIEHLLSYSFKKRKDRKQSAITRLLLLELYSLHGEAKKRICERRVVVIVVAE